MAISLHCSDIFSGLFSDPELSRFLNDDAFVKHMIRFESALAKVQGDLGIIPADDAQTIVSALSGAAVAPAKLSGGTVSTGVPVPALVGELRKSLDASATWLHWGATSQDVVDTATILQVKDCLDLLGARVSDLIDTLKTKSVTYDTQILAGRTRSQISTPITLGYRIAQWAHPLIEAEADFSALKMKVLKVQFGGASGTGSATAPHGAAISAGLAAELGLKDSPSWHLNRSGMLHLAGWLLQVSAALAKMAGDLVLSGRSEIGEITSGTGGGSSTMPQKANPVQAEAIQTLHGIVLAAHNGLAHATAPQEERDGASWALEWAFLPQIILATGTALRHAQDLAGSLEARTEKLASTLAGAPEIMAESASFLLAQNGVSRADAKALVAKAAASAEPFAAALSRLSPVDIDWEKELDPRTMIEPAKAMSARIFARRQQASGSC